MDKAKQANRKLEAKGEKAEANVRDANADTTGEKISAKAQKAKASAKDKWNT